MKNKLSAVFAVAACTLVLAGPALAHHADNMYDRDHPITLQGTVTEFSFVNPHPHIYFTVKEENGEVVKWIAESGSPPARMYNYGWRANALKPGDEITITGSPAKDGKKMLRIRKIVSPNGKTWTEGTP